MAEVRGASPLSSIYDDLMDEKIRRLERAAKKGDLQAAMAWFRAIRRADDKDYERQLEAMKLIAELQYPGLAETMRMLEEQQKLIQQVEIAPPEGEWVTEIIITDNTGGLEFLPQEVAGTTQLLFS